jgi:hypothetical protein
MGRQMRQVDYTFEPYLRVVTAASNDIIDIDMFYYILPKR